MDDNQRALEFDDLDEDDQGALELDEDEGASVHDDEAQEKGPPRMQYNLRGP